MIYLLNFILFICKSIEIAEHLPFKERNTFPIDFLLVLLPSLFLSKVSGGVGETSGFFSRARLKNFLYYKNTIMYDTKKTCHGHHVSLTAAYVIGLIFKTAKHGIEVS